ncbi:Formin-like protein 5 [Gossypium arboreum]|uniref:Formin-like protein 5 n=1 Tax=Gossypium arboreum TaxID=29729 RepID=A0A0B0N8W7_GOSAR|nr:Formin-like protein 5 [Gossypium arboreum]
MEASLKLVAFFTLLLSSAFTLCELASVGQRLKIKSRWKKEQRYVVLGVPTMIEAQKQLKCETDADCVRQCVTNFNVCTPAGYYACSGSNPNCC